MEEPNKCWARSKSLGRYTHLISPSQTILIALAKVFGPYSDQEQMSNRVNRTPNGTQTDGLLPSEYD